MKVIMLGKVHGLVLQNPINMGYLGVKTLVDHLQGKAVEKRIDTGVLFVGPDDLDKPEIQEMIKRLDDLKAQDNRRAGPWDDLPASLPTP